jgi:hypothetical protein
MLAPESDSNVPKSAASLYQGLKALWDAEFPKTCQKCARVYGSFEEYLMDTQALPHSSGLMEYDVGNPGQQVGLFRNCACATTIMAFCHDRRDLSEKGSMRRQLFGELMNRLVDTGISALEVRQELLVELSRAPDVDEFLKAVKLPPR